MVQPSDPLGTAHQLHAASLPGCQSCQTNTSRSAAPRRRVQCWQRDTLRHCSDQSDYPAVTAPTLVKCDTIQVYMAALPEAVASAAVSRAILGSAAPCLLFRCVVPEASSDRSWVCASPPFGHAYACSAPVSCTMSTLCTMQDTARPPSLATKQLYVATRRPRHW